MSDFRKDPDAVLDYEWDWSDYLATESDTLAASEFIITPDGLTADSDDHTTTTATVWLSGGDAGVTYQVTNRITTAGGRTDDRTRRVIVSNR